MTLAAISAGGSETQKSDWLARIVSGDAVAFCAEDPAP